MASTGFMLLGKMTAQDMCRKEARKVCEKDASD